MNVIAWLRTPIATLIVLCAALLAQLPHAADVFRLIVAGEGWPAVLHGYAYAVALELAVLLFVVQRRDLESYIFAGVSVMVNLSYYSLHGIQLFSVVALPAWLVSIALPAAIARYSHLLVEESPQDTKEEKPAKPEKTKNRTAAQIQTPVALPAGTTGHPIAPPSESGGHSEGAAQTGTAAEVEQAQDKPTPEQRRALIAEWQLQSSQQVIDAFNVSKRTADGDLAWVRKNIMHTNGVAK